MLKTEEMTPLEISRETGVSEVDVMKLKKNLDKKRISMIERDQIEEEPIY